MSVEGQGPWLVADVPPGSYTVHGEFGAERIVRSVAISPGGHRELVFVFARGDE